MPGFHVDFDSDDKPPAWWPAIEQRLTAMLTTILDNQEKIMATQTVNTDALVAIVARLTAADTSELAALQVLRDQNATLAAQLAALPPATDPASQAVVDAAVAALTATAASVEAAVAANPATPNLPPAPTA